nr:hypothetical protein [candidate division Zixibacteria bacterium]
MEILADDPRTAVPFWAVQSSWKKIALDDLTEELRPAAQRIFPTGFIYRTMVEFNSDWRYLLLVDHAKESHYDIITGLCHDGAALPGKMLCLAGSGEGFHGFHARPWVSPPGNIYLVVYLSPGQPVKNFGPGFMVLAAVSAVEAIDEFADLKDRAQIKWVNDIWVDNHKVGGVLAYSQVEGNIVTGVVLGIGLNVETTPRVTPSLFVPRAGCLADFSESEECRRDFFLQSLIDRLGKNCGRLLRGEYPALLEIYRSRSIIIDRMVEIIPDTPDEKQEPSVSGRVRGIGENLEVYLDGRTSPIRQGRLVIKN